MRLPRRAVAPATLTALLVLPACSGGATTATSTAPAPGGTVTHGAATTSASDPVSSEPPLTPTMTPANLPAGAPAPLRTLPAPGSGTRLPEGYAPAASCGVAEHAKEYELQVSLTSCLLSSPVTSFKSINVTRDGLSSVEREGEAKKVWMTRHGLVSEVIRVDQQLAGRVSGSRWVPVDLDASPSDAELTLAYGIDDEAEMRSVRLDDCYGWEVTPHNGGRTARCTELGTTNIGMTELEIEIDVNWLPILVHQKGSGEGTAWERELRFWDYGVPNAIQLPTS